MVFVRHVVMDTALDKQCFKEKELTVKYPSPIYTRLELELEL